MSTFSKILRELRKEKQLSGEELGKIFNVTKTAISYWENGKTFPDEITIKQIADYFNVSLDYLLRGSDTKKPKQDQLKEEPNPLLEKIENLSPESIEELEKYMELLKIKEQMDKSKEETSSALEKEA